MKLDLTDEIHVAAVMLSETPLITRERVVVISGTINPAILVFVTRSDCKKARVTTYVDVRRGAAHIVSCERLANTSIFIATDYYP